MQQKLLEKFQELFGGEGDIRSYFSPGRVNLIGEHTDYNSKRDYLLHISLFQWKKLIRF